MQRHLFPTMVLVAVFVSMIAAPAVAGTSTITSPADGEVVYTDTLTLTASTDAFYERTGWGVKTTCEPREGVVVNGVATTSDGSWDGSDFSMTIDITGWAPGYYCFAFNPGPNAGVRVTQGFYIVDDYVLVDSSIDDPLNEYSPDTRKPDYSVSGVVGLHGTESLAGMLELRYHASKVTCYADLTTGTFVTGAYSLDGDPDHDWLRMNDVAYLCDNEESGSFDDILLLEPGHQAPTTGMPLGAVAVDETFSTDPSHNRIADDAYDLVGTFGTSRNWVPFDRGWADFNIW